MTLKLTPPLAEGAPLEQHQADALPAAGEQRVAVTVMLTERHHEYLVARAAAHGEPPERHLETILRTFRSYHDDRRPDLRRDRPEPGGPTVARRA